MYADKKQVRNNYYHDISFSEYKSIIFTDIFIRNIGWIVFLSCQRSKFSITSITQHQWDCIVVMFHLNENGF